METIVVVVMVGWGPAWPKLVISVGVPLTGTPSLSVCSVMDNTPFETSSNKLRLLDEAFRTLPFLKYAREMGEISQHEDILLRFQWWFKRDDGPRTPPRSRQFFAVSAFGSSRRPGRVTLKKLST